MITSRIVLRGTTDSDWEQVKALRLEMLADTPTAFGETLAAALEVDEATWRERGWRGTNPHSALLAAIDEATGRWIGTMGGFVDDTADAMLESYAWRVGTRR